MAQLDRTPKLGFVKTTVPAAVADEELMSRLASGDIDALVLLHGRFGRIILNFALRQLDRSSAEETVQDVFLRVWQHSANFDARLGRVRPWLLQIAHHQISNELRRRRARPVGAADPDGLLLANRADGAPGVDQQVLDDEQRAAVHRAVRILPDPQREAVAMAFLAEMTQQEVAGALGVPLGTTKTRIRTGLLKLRTELASLRFAA